MCQKPSACFSLHVSMVPKAYQHIAEVVTGKPVNFLYTDSRGKYNFTKLNAYLIERGIHHEHRHATWE
jgi:hypothetical protein